MNNVINLLIPCAGQSERFFSEGFKVHKFLLPTNDQETVIESILKSFDKNIFIPHVVLTHEQLNLYKNQISSIKKTFSNLVVHSIEEHSLGPTYTLMQINIPEHEKVVVHYCDFLTQFKYSEIIKLLKNNFIVAPYFCGFHPASLGTTNFAYMILDPLKNLINLQEKKPFTENRILEPASTGIYGFPSFKIFKNLSEILLSRKNFQNLSEAYTSLLLNIALEEGLNVKCLEVEKFICLGTPRDYYEFIFWKNIHNKFKEATRDIFENSSHLITAAGDGSRFQKKNYRVTKIFNKLENKALIEHSIDSLNTKDNYVLLKSKNKNQFLKLLKKEKINIKIKDIEKKTNGQLLSLRELLKEEIKFKNFFVSSADYRFQINKTKFEKLLVDYNPDVVIFTTKWEYFAHEDTSNYGFVKINNNNQISEIIEKPKFDIKSELSNNLLIGTFWFKNRKIVEMLPTQNVHNKEVYIASSINKILNNLKVYAFEVDYWLSLGTPKELDLAKYWFDYFNNEFS